MMIFFKHFYDFNYKILEILYLYFFSDLLPNQILNTSIFQIVIYKTFLTIFSHLTKKNYMPNPPGLLTASKSRQFQCENCQLIFESDQALMKHKSKFCLNSKYENLDMLQKQFQQKSKGRDISLYGKPSLINFKENKTLIQDMTKLTQESQLLGIETAVKNNNSVILDKEYQSVLDELTNKETLRKKLDREKYQAYQELQLLQKRENEALIDLKHDELSQVLKRRKELQMQEAKIQEEMNLYEKKQKQMEKQVQMVDKEDYIYKEARYAGKLAKQRQILQEKKKQMEHQLKQKKKERNEIEHFLNQSQLKQKQVHFQPNFRKTQQDKPPYNRKVVPTSSSAIKSPEDSLDSLSFQNTNRNSKYNPYDQYNNSYNPVGPPSIPYQNVGVQHWPPNQEYQKVNQSTSPLQRSAAQIFNLLHQKHSNPLNDKDKEGDDMYPYFDPKKFAKNQKLLTDVLNRNGKSEEDMFIEMLNAQEYDSLNLLSKIPKGSELYQVKLKQYQQISKLRDQYKKQAHQKRVDKMKREFEYEKKIMEKQMQNALWVDQNRKVMLAQHIGIVSNQGQWQRDKDQLNRQASMQLNNQRKPNYRPPNFPNQQQANNQYSQNPNQYLNPQRPPPQNSQQNQPRNSLQNNQLKNQRFPPLENYESETSNNPYEDYLAKLNKIHSEEKFKHVQGNRFKNLNPMSNNSQNMMGMMENPSLMNQRLDFEKIQEEPSIDNDNYMWGYRITVQSMKNYNRTKPIKITLIMKQHDAKNQPTYMTNCIKYEFSTTYHYDKLGTQINSYNPNMSNKRDYNKNIIYNEDFTIPENLQQLYNKKQNDMYLWIIAHQKDETKLSNQPTIYGWYNLKLTHFGQIKEGKFTVNLYSDLYTYPHPSDMNKKKNKLNEEITIQLNEVLVEKQKPPEEQIIAQQPYNPPQVINLDPNKNDPQSLKNISQYPNNQQKPSSTEQGNRTIGGSQTSIFNNQLNSTKKTTTKEPNFIPLEKQTQFINVNAKTPKNIDIILTQLRTLPSYTGPVKMQLSFIDSEGIEVLPREEILSEIGKGDMYNPFINYVKMIRNEKLITPTTMLFIRFLALNALDYEIYMLGFTVFYLFFDQNANPCSSNSIKDFMISTGYFQLPIFWGTCKPFYSSIEDIIERYPLIPCSSLLIGCSLNDRGKPSKIATYGQRVYNTVLFHVQENQTKLFEEQYKREKLDSLKILGAYLKFKGFNEKYKEQQAKSYFFKTMSFTTDNVSNLFPLDYMAEYNPFFGVCFTIDKVILPRDKQNYYYFMTVCLSPPGEYYTSRMRDTDDLKFLYNVDVEKSLIYEVTYQNSEMIFQPKYDLNTCVIIQFKRVKVNRENQISQNLQSYAHVIVPLFKQIDQVNCVNVMKDTVNTYNGPYNHNDIQKMKNDLPSYLQQLVDNSKPSELEFSFRLMNGFFTSQFTPDKPLAPKEKKTSYLGWYTRAIDFEQSRKKVKMLIQRNYSITL